LRVGALDGGPPVTPPDDVDGATVAREVAARSFVLLRNQGYALPLEPSALTRVAVIGALARDARVLGGGSAQVTPPHVVSPLEGLGRALSGVDVQYAVGADPRPFLPPARGPEWTDLRVRVGSYEFEVDEATVRWIGDLPGRLDPAAVTSLRLRGTLTPSAGGEHTFAVSGFGTYELFVDGRRLFAGSLHPPGTGRAELLLDPREQRVSAELAQGVPIDVELRRTNPPGLAHTVAATLGHRPPGPGAEGLIAEAAGLAAEADVAIVVVGTTEQTESEGFDRTSLSLPGRQDELVVRVAAANPRTIVVVNAGAPVLMPWADDVAAVLLTWFPGQEAGAALADVLLGVTEPGGRLPTTWPRRAEDVPILAVRIEDGVMRYDEGVHIGYRAWERSGARPHFAFGHGLGYTSWSYDNLRIHHGTAEVTVTNTGARAGREVVQVYARPPGGVLGLAAFAAVEAHPGDSVTVHMPLPPRTFQMWDDGWRTVAGRYSIVAAHAIDDPRLTADLEV
jgi:beta-glucosidase